MGLPSLSLLVGFLSLPHSQITAPVLQNEQGTPVVREPMHQSLVAELEAHSSEGFRRLVENGRVNRCQSVDHWSVSDPASCYTWIMSQQSWHWIMRNTGSMTASPDFQLQRLYFTWAESDPKAALEAVANARIDANMGCGEVLWHLLQIDPMGTLPLYAEYGNRGRGGMRSGHLTWVRGDLLKLIEAIAALPAQGPRSWLLCEALEGFAKQDPAAALRWMEQQPIQDRNTFSSTIKGWATRDSSAALAYLTTQATDRERRWAAREVVEILSQKSPIQAWQAALDLHETGSVGVIALREWRNRDSLGAAEAVAALPNPQERDRVWAGMATTGWTHQDLDLWTVFMPVPQREKFLQEVMNHWSVNDLAAINEFLATAPEEQVTPELIKAAADHWHDQRSSSAAIQWAANLPEPYRESAMEGVLEKAYNTPDPIKEALKNISDPNLKAMALKALGSKAPAE